MERVVINKEKTGMLIKAKIKSSELSIEKISEWLGFNSPRVIYKWMKGEKLPSLESAYNLSMLLECKVEEIIGFEPMVHCG